jgi:dihydroorotate dehydrogenase (NAD+) catalytic subunit
MLQIELAGLKLRNPLMNASGVLSVSPATLIEGAKHAGAVVTKSIGQEERAGNANPTIAWVDNGLLNAMGFPNPGMKEFIPEIKEYIAAVKETPLICSIFAADPEGFAELARMARDAGAHAVELNLSCPHAKGFGMEVGSRPESVRDITSAVKGACNLPVFVKLTPNTDNIVALASAAEDAKADGIVAINTLRAMKIDIGFKRPVLASNAGIGGLSGQGILPVGVRCVYEIYDEVDVPVVGVGGVSTWQDAVEYILAGASAVQIGTALIGGNWLLFHDICERLKDYVKKEGFNDIKAIVGSAHKA